MRRFEVKIQRGREVETRIMRANGFGSLEGMAEDMIRDDYKITKITITNLATLFYLNTVLIFYYLYVLLRPGLVQLYNVL